METVQENDSAVRKTVQEWGEWQLTLDLGIGETVIVETLASWNPQAAVALASCWCTGNWAHCYIASVLFPQGKPKIKI